MSNLVMMPSAFRVKNVDLSSGDDDYSAKTYNVDLPVEVSVDEEMFITHFDNPFDIRVFSLKNSVKTNLFLFLLYKIKMRCPVNVVMFSTERYEKGVEGSFSSGSFYIEEVEKDLFKLFLDSILSEPMFSGVCFHNWLWSYDNNFLRIRSD